MDLLKDLIKNTRLIIVTTLNKEIEIYLYKINTDTLGDETPTPIEESFLKNRTDLINNRTLKITFNENEVNLDIMNREIIRYIEGSEADLKKISVINASKTHKFILEPDVFYAITQKTKNIYLDMGSESGIRLSGYEYPQLESITIEESVLFLDNSAVIYVSEIYGKWIGLLTYNKVNTPLTLNIFTEKFMKFLSVSQYASVKFLFDCKCKDGNEYENATCEINYLNIYGEEIIDNDKNDERILIRSFNNIYFDNIEIGNEVSYSTIIRADRINNFSIGSIIRTINTIVPRPMILLDRVAKVSLRKINIRAVETNTIKENDFAIVSFSPTEDDFERSISISDCTIYNYGNSLLKVIKLKKLEINKVYISNCVMGTNVDLLNIDESSNICKLTYNNCSFQSDNDFYIHGSTKISLIDTNFDTSSNIILNSPYISVNGGLWECENVKCNYEKNYIKLIFDNLELHSNNFEIINNEESSTTVFINNSKFDILKKLSISNIRISLMNTYVKSPDIDIKVDDIIQLNNMILGFQKSNKCNISIKANVNGKIIIDKIADTNVNIDLYIKDDKNINVNNLDFDLFDKKTNINIKTNKPINCIINGAGNPIHFSAYDNIDSSSNSFIRLISDDLGNQKSKVMNDSEKIVEFVKYMDDENRMVYEFSKI